MESGGVSAAGGVAGGVPPGPVVTPAAPADPVPSDPTPPVEPPEPVILVPQIDVVVGVADKDRRQTVENVKIGDLLPSRQLPVAMYLGNTDDSNYAEFLVSRDVEKVSGDGKCKPAADDCEFLRLGRDETAYLNFADGNRYVLRVKRIYFAKVSKERSKQNGQE